MKHFVLREVIFFSLIFLLFFLAYQSILYCSEKFPDQSQFIPWIIGSVFTGLIVGIFYLAKFNNSEQFRAFNISPGALCKGGWYLHQGDSPKARMCQEMAKTEEGRCDIAQFNCPVGYKGQPYRTFEYTSNSDDDWKGVRCKNNDVDSAFYTKPKDCGCDLCSTQFN